MPADENSSADPGADNNPDDTPKAAGADPEPRAGSPASGVEDAAPANADAGTARPDDAPAEADDAEKADVTDAGADGGDAPDAEPADDAAADTRSAEPVADAEPANSADSEDSADANSADTEPADAAGPDSVPVLDAVALATAVSPLGRPAGAEDAPSEPLSAAPAPAPADAPADPPSESSSGSGGADDGGGDGGAAPAPPPAPRKRRRGRRIALWTAAVLVVVLAAGVATAYGYYHSLRSGMVQHDLSTALKEEERPDKISDAVNILFIGSDGYEEGSTAYGSAFEGERSDSIMLAHISPDDRVSVISFPRDSLVELPECDAYGNTEGTYGYFGMVNAAMYHGGPPCVVRTVESLTDIRVDHFVHLSFMSFRDVVDAIGGVDICIPEPMSDRRSKLDIDAGQQTLDGDEALSFVRARYEIGDGGDIGRIDRQQMFLAALADQVTSSDVLSSPTKLNGILQAVAQHSATDRELTLDRMLSIAVTLADVDLSDIEFHTVPWYQAPFDPNRVMWHEEESAELFAAVREDRPLPALLAADEAAVPQDPPGASPTPEDRPSASPEDEASARPGEGRDATSNPCSDGLGFGTDEE